MNAALDHFVVMRRRMYLLPCKFTAMGVCAIALAGCWSSDSWDKEYSCTGQERSTTHLQGHPVTENYEKNYTAEIDFHIRGGAVLVKSHQATVRDATGTHFAFENANKDSSVNGTFDTSAHALKLQESRTLVVDGTPQDMRVVGTYSCTAL